MIKVVGYYRSADRHEDKVDLTFPAEGAAEFRRMFAGCSYQTASLDAARLMAFVTWVLIEVGQLGIEMTWASGSPADWSQAVGLSAQRLAAAVARLQDAGLLVAKHQIVQGQSMLHVSAATHDGPTTSWARPPAMHVDLEHGIGA